jgi:hypothetical protein
VLLLKVFFGSDAEPDALAEQLMRRRGEISSELETLREIERRNEETQDDELMVFPNLTLDWGLAIDPIELEWIDRTLERIAVLRRRTGAQSRPQTLAGRGG